MASKTPIEGTSQPSRATLSQGVSPRFLGPTLTYPWNAEVTERPRVSLAIMSQCKSDPDEDKAAPDAAIEPLLELIAGPESAADSSRRPCDEQIPNRAIEIEDRAQE